MNNDRTNAVKMTGVKPRTEWMATSITRNAGTESAGRPTAADHTIKSNGGRVMKESKLVVRYLDGRVVKGHTLDFSSTKEGFHLISGDRAAGSHEVRFNQIKAVFFVKDFIGNREYDERKEFDGSQKVMGKKMQVTFLDGEVLTGIAEVYMPNRVGFMLFPPDPKANTEKVFVVNNSVREVKFL
jgi:hypothetical protein